MLLLTTTGHVTGNAHTVPLLYLTDGPQYVVIASYGGRPQNPAWYLNLAANPVVQVQIGKARFSARAATVGPEDRRRLWPVVVEAYDGYAVYQARTEREIPVVLIHPDD
jgi:deazaflavin-dependent oxidoreductase (nitroreductase family)